MTSSVVPSVLRYIRIGMAFAEKLLGEIALAVLALDIIDIELCDSGSRRPLVQVLLKFVQRAAVTLSLTSDLSMKVRVIEIGKRYGPNIHFHHWRSERDR